MYMEREPKKSGYLYKLSISVLGGYEAYDLALVLGLGQ